MREIVFSRYKNFVVQNWDAVLLPKLAEMIAYAILFEDRKVIDHSSDPDWDASGSVRRHPDGESFDELDYEKLTDFLAETTGESMATYVSGCGLSYRSYRDKANEVLSEYLQYCREQLVVTAPAEEVQFFLNICKKADPKEIDRMDIAELFEELAFYDEEVDFEILFEKWIAKLDFQWMFRLGESLAINTHEEREKKKKRNLSVFRVKGINRSEHLRP